MRGSGVAGRGEEISGLLVSMLPGPWEDEANMGDMSLLQPCTGPRLRAGETRDSKMAG